MQRQLEGLLHDKQTLRIDFEREFDILMNNIRTLYSTVDDYADTFRRRDSPPPRRRGLEPRHRASPPHHRGSIPPRSS